MYIIDSHTYIDTYTQLYNTDIGTDTQLYMIMNRHRVIHF